MFDMPRYSDKARDNSYTTGRQDDTTLLRTDSEDQGFRGYTYVTDDNSSDVLNHDKLVNLLILSQRNQDKLLQTPSDDDKYKKMLRAVQGNSTDSPLLSSVAVSTPRKLQPSLFMTDFQQDA